MRRVVIAQPRPDCLAVEIGRDHRRAALLASLGVPVCGLMLLPERGTFASMLALFLGAASLGVIGVWLARALRTSKHTLARASGRLVLDTEPLDMARVELKLVVTPVFKRPTGYVLSLWVMTAVGPGEVLLGAFPTLLDASPVSGQFEDFVQRANFKQHRLV